MQNNDKTVETWLDIQKYATDAVVQLFVEIAHFDWLQPYRCAEQTQALGSGFFINEQGYFVNNFHVVSEALSIHIQIPSFGKQQFDTIIVGACPDRDIVLLRLTEESLREITAKIGKIHFLSLGDSDALLRTQEILVLGYPLGQENLKSTEGIISGRERVMGESYIQITAPLNPGNSGGPALDNAGKVIGINTAYISGAQNVGYIIPINDVRSIFTDLMQVKLLAKPTLGALFSPSNTDMLDYFKNPAPGGVYIVNVLEESVLATQGVKKGDMLYGIGFYKNGDLQMFDIDAYGDVSVPWSEDKVGLFDLVSRFVVNQKSVFIVYRHGKKIEISCNFIPMPPLAIRSKYPDFESIDYEVFGGLVFMDFAVNHLFAFADSQSGAALTPYEQYEKRKKPRLIISHVLPNSRAHHARSIFAGDLITEVNGDYVNTLDEYRTSLKKSIKTGFLSILVEDGRLTILALEKLLEEEQAYAARYGYRLSQFVQELDTIKP